jgi:hypothetical protein
MIVVECGPTSTTAKITVRHIPGGSLRRHRHAGRHGSLVLHEEHKEKEFREDMRKMSSKIHSEDSDRRESRVMTTSTNSVLIGGAGPGAPMAPAVA